MSHYRIFLSWRESSSSGVDSDNEELGSPLRKSAGLKAIEGAKKVLLHQMPPSRWRECGDPYCFWNSQGFLCSTIFL